MKPSALLLSFSLIGSFALHAQQNTPPVPSGILIEQASKLYDSGAYKKSIEIYQQIDKNDTNYIRALNGISSSCYADSQYNEAIRYCEKGLALAPASDPAQEPDLYNQYGNALSAAGNPTRALRIFDSALSKYPDYSLLRLNKGSVLLKLDRFQEAETLFQQNLLSDPYSYSSHYKLAIAAICQGKLIPAFLSLVGYLLVYPEGRYSGNAISLLSAISKNEDVIQKYVNERKEGTGENYQLLEQILQSKIALDPSYKPIIQLDDKISRQIQVIFEKMEYQESDTDFYMQYYIPYFKSIYTSNQFEHFINHIFSGVDLAVIKEYNKKNKKALSEFTTHAAEYFNLIRSSRQLIYIKRDTASLIWSHSDGQLAGHGKYLKKEDKLTGPWEFYYASGNIKSRGAFNEQGRRTGPWTYYYFDGTVKGKEIYRDGKQEDEETYYYSDGKPSTHSWYKNNEPEGESKAYYWGGTLRSVTHFQAGKKDGTKIGLTITGDTSYLENYSGGELNGTEKNWFENNQLQTVSQYVKGKLDGPFRKYYSNGKLSMEGEYKLDKQEGLWKFYHPNGQLKDAINFVNDKQEGEYKEYYDNGKLHITYLFRKGKINGEARYYDDDEKLFSIFLFDNDQLKKAQYFDKTGKLISQSDRQGKTMAVTGFLPDGTKRQEMSYNEKGDISGTETFYFPSGKVFETDEYQDGEEQGPSIVYFTNGQKKSETQYADGKMEGYRRTYYIDGKVQEEGWYHDNSVQGHWQAYNELGVLTDSTYYRDGELDGEKNTYFPNGKKEFKLTYHTGWLLEWEQFDSTGKKLADLHFQGGSGKLLLVYPDGKPYIEGTYLHNKLEGPRTLYYCDGKVIGREYYRKGLEDSVFKRYFHSGVLYEEGQYRLGVKTGVWKTYFSNGKISNTEEYVDGQLNGQQVSYLENGVIERITLFKDDEKNGVMKKIDPDGTLAYQLTYKNDKPIAYTYLDKNGALLPEIPIPGGTATIKTFYPNGNVSAEIQFKDGLKSGVDKLYYTNGKLRGQGRLEDGNWEGSYKGYYSNGQLKGEYLYFHDDLHGPYKEYNEKGILTEEGNYYLGSSHGITRTYDDQGKLKETELFYYGKLLSIK